MSTVTFGTLHARELFAPVLPVVRSVDPVFPQLQYTRVLVTPDSVHAYATDRYVLVESRQTVNNTDSGEMVLPLDAVTVLAKARGAEMVTYEQTGTVASVTLSGGQSWRFDAPTDYPDMARFGDKLTGSRITDDNWPFSVSTPVMDTLLKVCKASGKHATPVFQHVPGDHRASTRSGALAVRVTNDVRMLCVPARLSGDALGTELFPGWCPMSEVAADAKTVVPAVA